MADVTRPGPTVRVHATVSTPDGDRDVEDRVAAEEPLELRLAASSTEPRLTAEVELTGPARTVDHTRRLHPVFDTV